MGRVDVLHGRLQVHRDGRWRLLLAGEERYAETEGKEEFRQACLWDYSDVKREDRNQTDTFLLTAKLCKEKLSVMCLLLLIFSLII